MPEEIIKKSSPSHIQNLVSTANTPPAPRMAAKIGEPEWTLEAI